MIMGAIAANLMRDTTGGTFDFGQLLLSGDEQSGTDALKLSGDMTDGDDCELTKEPT
jgi:hypothetical protein